VIEEGGDTPLIISCKKGNLNIVKLLVDNGADINKKNKYGDTPLTISCEKGNFDIIKYLVEKGADINLFNSTGTSPLNILCRKSSENSLKIMDYLITKNESCIDKIDKNYNTTKNESCINKIDNNYNTPLLMSCYFNNKKMIKYLIRYSNINIQNNYQDSSLIISCYFDNSTIVGYLIEKNANEYLKNIYGDICFSIAKKLKNENSLKKLEESNFFLYISL